MMTKRTLTLGSLVLLTGLIAGACSAAGPSPTAIAPSLPPDTVVTSPPGGGGGGGGVDPGNPPPQFVVPKPGQLNVQPVFITKLTASLNGRALTVQADWVSGVEPCYVLDHIAVGLTGTTYTIGVFEGSADPNAACIKIAAFKATIIGLGDLEPGTYTIQASHGDAAAVTVIVP